MITKQQRHQKPLPVPKYLNFFEHYFWRGFYAVILSCIILKFICFFHMLRILWYFILPVLLSFVQWFALSKDIMQNQSYGGNDVDARQRRKFIILRVHATSFLRLLLGFVAFFYVGFFEVTASEWRVSSLFNFFSNGEVKEETWWKVFKI